MARHCTILYEIIAGRRACNASNRRQPHVKFSVDRLGVAHKRLGARRYLADLDSDDGCGQPPVAPTNVDSERLVVQPSTGWSVMAPRARHAGLSPTASLFRADVLPPGAIEAAQAPLRAFALSPQASRKMSANISCSAEFCRLFKHRPRVQGCGFRTLSSGMGPSRSLLTGCGFDATHAIIRAVRPKIVKMPCSIISFTYTLLAFQGGEN